MNDIEKGRLVAEKVMGWVWFDYPCCEGWYPSTTDLDDPDHVDTDTLIKVSFYPLTSVHDDYEVLRHVVENWSEMRRKGFANKLSEIYEARYPQWNWEKMGDTLLLTCYEVGDYAQAALAAATY